MVALQVMTAMRDTELKIAGWRLPWIEVGDAAGGGEDSGRENSDVRDGDDGISDSNNDVVAGDSEGSGDSDDVIMIVRLCRQ